MPSEQAPLQLPLAEVLSKWAKAMNTSTLKIASCPLALDNGCAFQTLGAGQNPSLFVSNDVAVIGYETTTGLHLARLTVPANGLTTVNTNVTFGVGGDHDPLLAGDLTNLSLFSVSATSPESLTLRRQRCTWLRCAADADASLGGADADGAFAGAGGRFVVDGAVAVVVEAVADLGSGPKGADTDAEGAGVAALNTGVAGAGARAAGARLAGLALGAAAVWPRGGGHAELCDTAVAFEAGVVCVAGAGALLLEVGERGQHSAGQRDQRDGEEAPHAVSSRGERSGDTRRY